MINIEGSIRRMQKKDVTQVLKLLQSQQKKYKFRYKYSQEDIIHYLIPKEEDNLTWTYVIENEDENGKVIITDFFSMNRLTNTCTDKNRSEYGHSHKEMNIAFAYLYALSKNTLQDVFKQQLIIAKEELNCDAFTVQTIMDNTPEVFESLDFSKGDGAFYWYICNWSLGEKTIGPNDIGIVLI